MLVINLLILAANKQVIMDLKHLPQHIDPVYCDGLYLWESQRGGTWGRGCSGGERGWNIGGGAV